MRDTPNRGEPKKSSAFGRYLRTGRRFSNEFAAGLQQKFNPYHDPRDGRFTFAPGGPRSQIAPDFNQRRDHLRPIARQTRNPRVRIGNNGGPPLNDPMTIQELFPDLPKVPGGAIVALGDSIFDLAGPARALTTQLSTEYINKIISDIRSVYPKYRLESLGQPNTLQGNINMIQQLRWERAAIFYRIKGDIGPLQVESIRYIQEMTDLAYEQSSRNFGAGVIRPKLHRAEAIGNAVDKSVKAQVREMFNRFNIPVSKSGTIRINGREYGTIKGPSTYTIPDFRIGRILIDPSLEAKNYGKVQVRGFIDSNMRPDLVIIVRPSQLGPNNIYAIAPLER